MKYLIVSRRLFLTHLYYSLIHRWPVRIYYSKKETIWQSRVLGMRLYYSHKWRVMFSTNLIQNSKNKIFGNEIPCILDFSHFEPVEAWIWFPEVMTSKFFEHDNLTSKTHPFPENTQFNKNNLVQSESGFILDQGSIQRQSQCHVRVTVTFMSGIKVPLFLNVM